MVEPIVLVHGQHLFATSTVQVAAQRVGAEWKWYIVRAAGFTAAGLLILLMLSGIGQVTGLTYRFVEPIKAWAIHKALAIALCVAVVIHVLFILLDTFVPFSLAQVLVPFLSHYSNKAPLFGLNISNIAVALGILSAYGIAIIVTSSLLWIDKHKTTKRRLHYLSYVVILFVFAHALGTGSDLKYGTFRSAWIFLFIIVAVAIFSRLWRAGTMRKSEAKSDAEQKSL